MTTQNAFKAVEMRRKSKRKFPRKNPSQKALKRAQFFHATHEELTRIELRQIELPWWVEK